LWRDNGDLEGRRAGRHGGERRGVSRLGRHAGDATLMAQDSAAPDATSYDAVANYDAADGAVDALDASFDAHPDVVWIPPVQ
jgi:hypothetical protein